MDMKPIMKSFVEELRSIEVIGDTFAFAFLQGFLLTILYWIVK